MDRNDIAYLLVTNIQKHKDNLDSTDIRLLPHEWMPADSNGTRQWDVYVPVRQQADFEKMLDQFMRSEMNLHKVGLETVVRKGNYQVAPQFTEDQIEELRTIGYPLSYQLFFANEDVAQIKAKAAEMIRQTAGVIVAEAAIAGADNCQTTQRRAGLG